MKRSLIAFQALLASSAVLCQSAEASNTYIAPDQRGSSLEARIHAAQTGDWSSLLNPSDAEGQLVAKSKWGNGARPQIQQQPRFRQMEERQGRQQVDQQPQRLA